MKLLGREFVTDYQPLLLALRAAADGQENALIDFPGFEIAVVNALRDVDKQRTHAVLITYRCFRVQAWAEDKFDVEPSKTYRVMPRNVAVHSLEQVSPLT